MKTLLLVFIIIPAAFAMAQDPFSDAVNAAEQAKQAVTAPPKFATREYQVPPEFFGGADTDAKREQMFANDGIQFPQGSSMHYDPVKKILTIRDTEDELVLVDKLVAIWTAAKAKP
ncbi:MAG TPA: hypothetical protein VG733_11215 [Chthoniobacteraceae bacterium]|nr:hypothetical protein [Chthoniobacteraceae bacterium]